MSKALSTELFPVIYKDLLTFHDVLDKIVCFIVKRKMACSLSKIEKVYQTVEGRVFPLTMFTELCSFYPKMYILRDFQLGWTEKTVKTKDLEFVFHKACDGTGPSHVSKRRKQLLEHMQTALLGKYASYLTDLEKSNPGLAKELQSLKVIKEGTWPNSFNVDIECLLPAVEPSLQELLNSYATWRDAQVAASSNGAPFSMQASQNTGMLGTYDDCPSQPHMPVSAVSITEDGGAEGVLEYLKSADSYKDQLVHVERIAGRAAVYAALAPPALPSVLTQRLVDELGLQQLYLHQARAIDALRAGKHTVVSTSTASGKSVIYNIPVLEAVLQEPLTTALYLFPTKVCDVVLYTYTSCQCGERISRVCNLTLCAISTHAQ
jgi:hypothetical protein